MDTATFFARRPVFTREEFLASRDAAADSEDRTADALLAYHVKAGNLLRIRQGLYGYVPPGYDPETTPVDGYLVASKLAEDAVIGYHSALELHGVAYSASDRFLYLTHREKRPLRFRSLEFRSVLVPKPLREGNMPDVGVTKVDRSGMDVAVTTLERTLVDVLDRPDLGGGWEEVWRSLESVSFFDLREVIDYALLLGNRTTAAKVGFFLQQHEEELAVDQEHLDQLRQHIPRQPHYVNGSRDSSNVLLSEWNIIVPTAIIGRSWQAVL